MKSQKLLKIRKEIIEILKRLKRELNAEVYLFGSFAKQTHALESDVDIVVVSNIFENLDHIERVKIVRMKLPKNIGFDIIPLTPKELENKMRKTFYKEISKHWIKIE